MTQRVRKPIKSFPIDVLVDADDLCNLATEARFLINGLKQGKHIVLFGRRNTGKSSLVKNVVIPSMRQANKNLIPVFADLLSVRSLGDIATRIQRGFEIGLSAALPIRRFFDSLTKMLSGLRPVLKTDPHTGDVSIGFEMTHESPIKSLPALFENIRKLNTRYGVVIALDEFQDIGDVSSADGIIRDCLQNLPYDLPVIILGSKKHLLANLFARAKAPLAGWGIDYEIPIIHTAQYRKAYLDYVNERFQLYGLGIESEVMDYLIDRLGGIPEAVNIVAQTAIQSEKVGTLNKHAVDRTIHQAVLLRERRFNELYSRFSDVEQAVLIAIAKYGPIQQPKSKDFLCKVSGISPTGLFNAFKRLERHADIYKENAGYVVADPLFTEFLKIMN